VADTPDTLVVDLNSLTINDLIEFEDIAGVTFDEFTSEVAGKDKTFSTTQMMRVYRALLFIIGRRDNPDLTIEQAGEANLGSIATLELKGAKANPTNGGASKAGA
jgi:hypothetical protein